MRGHVKKITGGPKASGRPKNIEGTGACTFNCRWNRL